MSHQPIQRWLLGAAGLVAAATIGRWTAEPAPAAAPEHVRTAAVERVIAVPSVAARNDIDRAAMRAEIRAAVASAVVPAPTAEAEEPVQVAIPAEAAQMIANAVGRSSWTAEDWRALDELTRRVSPEESFEAFRQLGVAVNSGQIKDLAPPLL